MNRVSGNQDFELVNFVLTPLIFNSRRSFQDALAGWISGHFLHFEPVISNTLPWYFLSNCLMIRSVQSYGLGELGYHFSGNSWLPTWRLGITRTIADLSSKLGYLIEKHYCNWDQTPSILLDNYFQNIMFEISMVKKSILPMERECVKKLGQLNTVWKMKTNTLKHETMVSAVCFAIFLIM